MKTIIYIEERLIYLYILAERPASLIGLKLKHVSEMTITLSLFYTYRIIHYIYRIW